MDRRLIAPIAAIVFLISLIIGMMVAGSAERNDPDGVDGVTITHTTNDRGQPCTVAKTAQGVSIDCEDDGK